MHAHTDAVNFSKTGSTAAQNHKTEAFRLHNIAEVYDLPIAA